MNTKALLVEAIAFVIFAGLATVPTMTVGLVGTQASAQSENMSSANIIGGSALYNLTLGDRAYPIVFNISGGQFLNQNNISSLCMP